MRLVLSALLAIAALGGLAAPPAEAISRGQATKAALKAIHAKRQDVPLALFALKRPVPAGTEAFEARPGRGRAVRAGRRAWLLWADFAYSAQFAHPSRLLLVDDRSGRVIANKSMLWQLYVNRRLAPWLRSDRAYGSTRYIVYSNFRRFPRRARASNYPANGQVPNRANQLREDCLVMIGDFDFFKGNLKAMSGFAKKVGLKTPAKPPKNAAELGKAVDDLVNNATSADGCRDVFIYLTGHGVPPEGKDFPAGAKKEVVLGPGKVQDIEEFGLEKAGPAGVRVEAGASLENLTTGDKSSYITPQNLIDIAKDHSIDAEFKIKIDACFAGRFERVFDEATNVRLIELSSAFNEISYGKGSMWGNQPKVDPETKKETWSRSTSTRSATPTTPPGSPTATCTACTSGRGRRRTTSRSWRESRSRTTSAPARTSLGSAGWTRPKSKTARPGASESEDRAPDVGSRSRIDVFDPDEFFVDGVAYNEGEGQSTSPLDAIAFVVPNRTVDGLHLPVRSSRREAALAAQSPAPAAACRWTSRSG